MFSQRVRNVMQHDKMLVANSESTVEQAARLLADSKVGAVLVVDQGQLAGIFTESDAVARVLAVGRDACTTRLAEVMTPNPRTVSSDATFGHALQLMHKFGLRHVPVVEEGKLVGIVRARDALDPEMEEFASEALRREYYTDNVLPLPQVRR